MECFLQCSPCNAFFMLSNMWSIFYNPLDYLSSTSGGRRKPLASNEAYDLLQPIFKGHAILTPNTQESLYLDTLDYLLHLWTDKNGQASVASTEIPGSFKCCLQGIQAFADI